MTTSLEDHASMRLAGEEVECQQCGWVGEESELIAPFSDWEPVCPDCWSSDFLDKEEICQTNANAVR